jgi:glycine/D-amino acid oxidase-like deaminating enzyme
MTNIDWIVIGAGITGSALAYELSQKSFKVLLLEKDFLADNATLYSYGGLPFWSGITPLARQLGQEGIELYRHLATELNADLEFRELDLLLTVNAEDNPALVAQNYQKFAIQPEILDAKTACQIEPLLDKNTISGVLKLPHGQVNAQKTALAYQQAFQRSGGKIKYEKVISLIRDRDNIQGVITTQNTYQADNTVVCTGGLTRSLLKTAGITTQIYFTHAGVIKTEPVDDLALRSIIMPAVQKRFALETTAKNLKSAAWQNANSAVLHSILDAGAAQLNDGSFYLGQISTIATDPHYIPNSAIAENQIREEIARILPSLAKIPGTCHHCLVAFNGESIAVVGNLKNLKGIYLFSGFTSTMIFAPPLAKHFADWVSGKVDPIMQQLNYFNSDRELLDHEI